MLQLNPFRLIKNYFNSRKKENEQQLKVWENVLFINGFNKIVFPILIIDRNDLSYVADLKEFAVDPDLHFHEFPSDLELLDSEGKLRSWKYDNRIKSNMPGEIKKILNLQEVKGLIRIQFEGTKVENDIINAMNRINSIKELLIFISNKV